MRPSPMIIDRKILLVVAVLSFLTVLMGAWLKITHISFGPFTANFLLTIGIIPGLLVWLAVLYDIIKHSFRNSLLWVIGIFCFGSLVSIIYLVQRDQLVGHN